MSEIDTSTDRIMRLNRLGQADYLHIALVKERDALRERAEKAEAKLRDLVEQGPCIDGCNDREPGLRALLLCYYLNWFSSAKSDEATEMYLHALRNEGGDE